MCRLVRAEEGQGSTFYFTLPVLPQEPATPPDSDVPFSIGEGMRIEASAADRSEVVLLRLNATGRCLRELCEHLAAQGFAVGDAGRRAPGGDWLAQTSPNLPGAVVLDFEPAVERWLASDEGAQSKPRTPRRSPGRVLHGSASDGRRRSVEVGLRGQAPGQVDELALALERQDVQPGRLQDRSNGLDRGRRPRLSCDLHARVVQAHLPVAYVS